MKLLKLLGLCVLVAAIGFGGWAYLKKDGDEKKPGAMNTRNAGPVPVSAAAAERRDVPFSLSVVGAVVTEQSVAVRARIDSQLTEVKFRDGDQVKAGDVLFVLDDRTIQAQIKELQANLVRDRAQSENASRQFERKKSLAERGFETKANLDAAEADFAVQRATINATQASIDNLKVQLEYTRIVAPISGRTGTIGATVGNNVRANDATPMVTINQVSPIRAQVSVAQRYLERLRAAMALGPVAVQAKSEGGGTVSTGVLDYIDNTIDQTTGTFNARASFANEDEKLWPGMFVTVEINLGDEKGALTVPEVAIQHGQDGDFVFTIIDGKAQKTPVKIERIQQGSVIIAEGLQGGEQVITDGMLRIENGSAVVVGSGDATTGATPAKAGVQ